MYSKNFVAAIYIIAVIVIMLAGIRHAKHAVDSKKRSLALPIRTFSSYQDVPSW